MIILQLFDSRPGMDRRTDKASHTDACPQLKKVSNKAVSVVRGWGKAVEDLGRGGDTKIQREMDRQMKQSTDQSDRLNDIELRGRLHSLSQEKLNENRFRIYGEALRVFCHYSVATEYIFFLIFLYSLFFFRKKKPFSMSQRK